MMGEGGSVMAESRQVRTVKLVKAANISAWAGALLADHGVWAPVRAGGQTLFRRLAAGDEDKLDLETLRTVNSPKGALLPQTEPLMF